MKKIAKTMLVISVSTSLLFAGCNGNTSSKGNDAGASAQPTNSQNTTDPSKQGTNTAQPVIKIDYEKVKPNENGKIMVVMFHNFVESFTPTKWDKGEYTTTFDEFRTLLTTLYEKDYRLVSMNDFINNNISVPAGCIPMVFTFDDGTAGQFSLSEENGKLVANKQTAVAIMEEFNKTHPDFGLKGTFYVNLGLETFDGKGTVTERLKYLTEKGFDIGNHTSTHIHLNQVKNAEKIQEEIGGNQKKMYELIPNYKMQTFSLPFGQPAKTLKGFVEKGEYAGVKYENTAIMEVGWDPSVSPISKKFNPLSVHRVRASGITPVQADLAWWFENISRSEQYVSDGNADTVAIPKVKEVDINKDKLNNKKIVTY